MAARLEKEERCRFKAAFYFNQTQKIFFRNFIRTSHIKGSKMKITNIKAQNFKGAIFIKNESALKQELLKCEPQYAAAISENLSMLKKAVKKSTPRGNIYNLDVKIAAVNIDTLVKINKKHYPVFHDSETCMLEVKQKLPRPYYKRGLNLWKNILLKDINKEQTPKGHRITKDSNYRAQREDIDRAFEEVATSIVQNSRFDRRA